MTANYHTHTARCMHAVGTEREYVERAIEGKLGVLGFSDHTPYPFPSGYYSNFRMRMDQLDDYCGTVLALAREYRGEIEIHLGLEVEYYPAYFDALLRALEDSPVEYLLLGQHFLDSEIGAPYSGAETSDPAVLRKYCAQVTEAMSTGRFTYLAHPDLINFRGDDGIYEDCMRRLCRSAVKYGLPVEINFLGLREGRNYPDRRFWRIAGEEKCTAVLGCDAHDAKAVWAPETERAARALAGEFGLEIAETVALRDPFGRAPA